MAMRDITYTVYRFEELPDNAKEKAVESVVDMLARTWDSGDTEDVENVMVWTLAERFHTPGWDTYGVGDFPGIPGITVKEWDIDRGWSLKLCGTLNRDNAPHLPWSGRVESIDCGNVDYWRTFRPVTDDGEHIDDQDHPVIVAVKGAIEIALRAGRAEMEYKTSTEYAREWIDGNAPEFREDGTLYGS